MCTSAKYHNCTTAVHLGQRNSIFKQSKLHTIQEVQGPHHSNEKTVQINKHI